MPKATDEEWGKAEEECSQGTIFQWRPDQQTHLNMQPAPVGMKGQHEPNLGKSVAAGPLLV